MSQFEKNDARHDLLMRVKDIQKRQQLCKDAGIDIDSVMKGVLKKSIKKPSQSSNDIEKKETWSGVLGLFLGSLLP